MRMLVLFTLQVNREEHAGVLFITKRDWGAFASTELDLQLRQRGVSRIVRSFVLLVLLLSE
jgi:nicotinamidase-related amidase